MRLSGHSIQARLYAEDPARNFRPSSGVLSHVRCRTDVRVDGWIETGTEVPSFYDPLLAKIITHGETRGGAREAARRRWPTRSLYGIETNLAYLRGHSRAARRSAPDISTRSSFDVRASPLRSVEVLKPGTHTTVQEYPGRLGYWNVGVPPSGPMDALAFRLANRIVGNREWHAALEITGTGPTLQLRRRRRVIALAGAEHGRNARRPARSVLGSRSLSPAGSGAGAGRDSRAQGSARISP